MLVGKYTCRWDAGCLDAAWLLNLEQLSGRGALAEEWHLPLIRSRMSTYTEQ